MKITAVVPIKMNNQRLPGKNTLVFHNGKPLCWYIFATLLKISLVDEIYVYCSDPCITNYIPEDVQYLKRDPIFDHDATKMNSILYEFYNEKPSDIYIMTHATSPFISEKSIENGLNKVAFENFDSAFSVKLIKEFIWKNGNPYNYSLDDIPRTQDLLPLYIETSGFYIYKSSVISKKRRIGDKPALIEVNEIESIDINNHNDFQIADAIFNHIMKK